MISLRDICLKRNYQQSLEFEKLSTKIEMKNLEQLKHFLGIKVTYSKEGILISQRKYVVDLWQEIGKF